MRVLTTNRHEIYLQTLAETNWQIDVLTKLANHIEDQLDDNALLKDPE